MTVERMKCPTSDLTGDRHMVTDRRWVLTDPSGAEVVVCSPCCVIFWLSYALPPDVHQRTPMQAPRPHARQELAAGDSGLLLRIAKVGATLAMMGAAR